MWLASLALTLRWHLPCSDPRLRLVVILLGLQALVAELAVTKVDRHILPLGLGFSLLVGFWAARLCRRGRVLGRPASGPSAARAGRWSATLGATALLLWQLRGLGPAAPSGTSTGPSPLLEFLAGDVRERGPALVVGSIGLEETPAAIDWHLAVQGLLPPEGAGSLVQGSDLRFLDTGRSRLPSSVPEPIREQVDRWPGGGGTYTACLGLPFGAPQLVLAPANVGGRVRALLARHPSDRVVVVLPNGSPLPQTLVGGLADLGFEPTGTTPDRLAEARHDLVEFKRAR